MEREVGACSPGEYVTASVVTHHGPAPLRVGAVSGMDLRPDVLPWPTAMGAGVTVGGPAGGASTGNGVTVGGAAGGASTGDDVILDPRALTEDDATQHLRAPPRVGVVCGMDLCPDVLPWPTAVVARVTVGGAGVAGRASDEDDATLHRAALPGDDATQHRTAPLRVIVVGGMDLWPDVLP